MTPETEIVRRLATHEVGCPCLEGISCTWCEIRHEETSQWDECLQTCSNCKGYSVVPLIPGLRTLCHHVEYEELWHTELTVETPWNFNDEYWLEAVYDGIPSSCNCLGTDWQPVEPNTALRVCLEWVAHKGYHIAINDHWVALWEPGNRYKYPDISIDNGNVALAIFQAVEQIMEASQ